MILFLQLYVVLSICLVSLFGFANNEIDLVISSPRNHETLTIIPESSYTSINLQYNISPSTISTTPIVPSSYRLCVEVLDTLSEELIIRNNCYEVTSLSATIDNVPEGDYLITSYVMLIIDSRSNQMVSHKRSTRVKVKPEVTSLSTGSINLPSPTIRLKSREYVEATNTMTFITAYGADSSSISINYGLDEDMEVPIDEVEFCLKIIILSPNDNQHVLEFTCISPYQNPFSLSNMKVDNYILFLVLRKKDDMKIITSSKRDIFLSIRPIDQSLPTISFPSCNKVQGAGVCVTSDFMAEGVIPYDEEKASIPIIYQLFGYVNSYDHVKVCVEVHDVEHDTIMHPLLCLPQNQNMMTMNNMVAGRYEIMFMLALADDEEVMFNASKKIVSLQVQHEEEFVPTYDWQTLHAWHTIPNGIETRLPLGKNSIKEARIPNPWRLQLTMPDPCRYFIRMDVYRDSRIIDILNEASKKCDIDVNCFELHDEVEVFRVDSTVDETSLFNRQPILRLKPDC